MNTLLRCKCNAEWRSLFIKQSTAKETFHNGYADFLFLAEPVELSPFRIYTGVILIIAAK